MTFFILTCFFFLTVILKRYAVYMSKPPPEIAAFITTGDRNGVLYLNKVVDALINQGNVTDIIVFNTEMSRDHLKEFSKKHLVVDRNKIFRMRSRGEDFNSDVKKSNEYKIAKSDILQRKEWRTKECWDFVNAGKLALRKWPETPYLLFVEDDNVYSKDKSVIQLYKKYGKPPIMYMGGHSGAIVFHRDVLESFIGYSLLRCDLVPIDWLLDKFIQSIGINVIRVRNFKHVGKSSTKHFVLKIEN